MCVLQHRAAQAEIVLQRLQQLSRRDMVRSGDRRYHAMAAPVKPGDFESQVPPLDCVVAKYIFISIMPPKSILKNKSSAHAGPSSAWGGKSGSGSGNAKGNGNGRDMERNTRINAGSKFQKSLQVERVGGAGAAGRGNGRSSAGKAGKAGGKAAVQGRRGKDGDVNEDYVSDEGESSDGFGGVDADGDEKMSDGSADTDEEIARGVGGGEKKKSTSELWG